MPAMRRDRREAELARWLRALPDDVVRRRPVLGIGFVGALAQVSDFADASSSGCPTSSARALDGGSWPEQPPPSSSSSTSDAYRRSRRRSRCTGPRWRSRAATSTAPITHARAAMCSAPPDDDLTRALGGALGGARVLDRGDLAGAHAAYTATVAGLTSGGYLADVLGCSIALGDIRRTQGRLGDALRTYEQALELARRRRAPPLRGTADMHVGIAEVLLERDDLAGAARAPGHQPARSASTTGCRRTRTGGASPRPGCGRPKATSTARWSCSTRPSASTTATTPRRAAGARRAGPAAAAARRAARPRRGRASGGCPPDDDLTYLREYEHVTLARLLLARHRRRADARRSTTRSACSSGCSRPPRTAGGAAAPSRSSSCWRCAHQAPATRRPPSPR